MSAWAPRIGLVGVGEVGSVVADELLGVGRRPCCFDSRPGEITDPAARRLGLELYRSAAEFGANVDAVIVTVIGRASPDVAREVVPHLAPGTLYSDWATTSPGARDGVAALCDETGVRFADVSILDTVTWIDRPIELLTSGPGATLLPAVLDGTRLSPKVIDEERPVSTEVKLMRSVFTKGLEALLLETLGGAAQLGIRGEVEQSILRFMQEDFTRVIALLVGSSMKHAERRANEVHDVQEFITRSLGGAPMTAGAVQILDGLVALNDAHPEPPPDDAGAVLARVVSERLFALVTDGVVAG
jgi:3-hydroxyisobutyrate dehydrogenase